MRRDRIDFRQEWMRRPQLMLPDNVPAPGPKPVVGPPPLPGLPSRQEVYGDPIRPGAIPQKPLPQGSDVPPPPNEPDAGQLSGTVREPTPAEDYELSFQDKPEKGWKEALYMGLQAINKIFNPDDNRPITSLTEDKRQMRIARAKQRYDASQAQETAEQNRRLREAQIQTIPIDDENKRRQIELNAQLTQEKMQSGALGRLTKLKYFDPKNPAHARLAAEAGLDAGELNGWDDRSVETKSVAGVLYQRNRQTGQYEPTNLPVDEAKTIVDYEVTMPSGEKRKYRVAQKDAANFATQMSSLGARLEQAERHFQQRIKLDTAKFNQAKSEFERVQKLREKALAENNTKAAQELHVTLTKMMESAAKALSDGEIDQGQYDILMQLIGNTPRY